MFGRFKTVITRIKTNKQQFCCQQSGESSVFYLYTRIVTHCVHGMEQRRIYCCFCNMSSLTLETQVRGCLMETFSTASIKNFSRVACVVRRILFWGNVKWKKTKFQKNEGTDANCDFGNKIKYEIDPSLILKSTQGFKVFPREEFLNIGISCVLTKWRTFQENNHFILLKRRGQHRR